MALLVCWIKISWLIIIVLLIVFLALCRFASEIGPLRALAAAEQGSLSVHGKQPKVSLIETRVLADRPELGRRAISTPCESSHSIQKPNLGRRRSHQRNILSIDTLITESPPFLRLINENEIDSPLESSCLVVPSGFDKIPSTTQNSKQHSDTSNFFIDVPTVSPYSDRTSALGFD